MDKLEPIIRHRFWILLGITFILTIVGWSKATSALAQKITARKADIEKANGKLKSTAPSKDYATKVAAINERQTKQVDMAVNHLWESQRAVMVWPSDLAEPAKKAGYWGEFAALPRGWYRTSYGREVRRVWNTINPFNPLTGKGMVDFPIERMPVTYFGEISPPSELMWQKQEDLWLLEGLFKSISSLNGGVENINRLDAVVHQISVLKLMGGDPANIALADAGGGDGGGGGPGSMPGMPGSMPGGPPRGFATGGGGAQAESVGSSDFSFEDEFGTGGEVMGGGGTGAAGGGGPGAAMASRMSAMGPADGASGGESEVAALRRYILDDETQYPYKTRGFYMTVMMDHRRIPDLISALSGNEVSPWPVEIVRVQMVRVNDDSAGGVTGGITGGPPGGGFNPGAFGPGGSRPGIGSGEGGAPPADEDGEDKGPQNQRQQNMVLAANAAYAAALADPNTASVSIAGYFMLYRKPPEPAELPPEATAQPTASEPIAEAPASTPLEAATVEAGADGDLVNPSGEILEETGTGGSNPVGLPGEMPADESGTDSAVVPGGLPGGGLTDSPETVESTDTAPGDGEMPSDGADPNGDPATGEPAPAKSP